MTIKTTPANCVPLREAITARSFIGWRGFTDGCTPAILLDALPADFSELAYWDLGSSFTRSQFVPLTLGGYDGARVSFQGGRAVLFNGAPQSIGNLQALLDDLSEPAAKLNWYDGLLEMPSGEWAFPARGITLFLNSSFETLLHLALYDSTSLEDYTTRLRPDFRVRKIPRR
jgi:hypothetical protein